MTEAALHWLEYLDASDCDSARLAHAVKMLPGGPVIDPPRPRCASEQLAPDFVRMHQAGLIRAIASALDCLAGVIIGVAALPHSGGLATTRQVELRDRQFVQPASCCVNTTAYLSPSGA